MKSARLLLEERDLAWTLVVEPWALAFDVPAHKRVHVEVFDDADHFHLEIADGGAFLAFESGKFQIKIGEAQHDYDFQSRFPVFEGLWQAGA